MITLPYVDELINFLQTSHFVELRLLNHGQHREVLPDGSITFYPIEPLPKYHSIALTAGWDQTREQIAKDAFKGRILLVGEAANAAGAHVYLEDECHHMTLTGTVQADALTYCRRVVKAIVNVTGAAESKGMSVHDYITQLAD